MAEPKDAILPVLQKIQDDVTAIRREQQAAKVRDIELTEAIHTNTDQISSMRKDQLLHLGLTTRHRLDFEELLTQLDDLNARVAALESRS